MSVCNEVAGAGVDTDEGGGRLRSLGDSQRIAVALDLSDPRIRALQIHTLALLVAVSSHGLPGAGDAGAHERTAQVRDGLKFSTNAL
jgi:hypothetical protein